MKTKILLLLIIGIIGIQMLYSQTSSKPKVIVTTDMGADPDDEQSMVRFFVQSNEFDIKGLIVSTSCWKKSTSTTVMNQYMNPLLTAYECAYPNLKVHADGYPTPAYLKSITVLGNTGYAMAAVGSGKDSPGSNLIIAAVDATTPDDPICVQSWGGSNTLAQAIWKVKNTRTTAQLNEFISKVYCYDILGQDDAGAWLAKNFPNLLYMRGTKVYNWQRSKSDSWWSTNIQSHGCLGKVYPSGKYAMEGDTPAFLHTAGRGLNDHSDPKQRGWGGQFASTTSNIRGMSAVSGESVYDTYKMLTHSLGPETFKQAIENDFQARMDWANSSSFSSANHHPNVVLNGDDSNDIIKIFASAGGKVSLSVDGTTDPDNNSLSYSWSYYQTDGDYNSSISISNSTSKTASITVPSGASKNEMHFVVAVVDNGSPALTSYRRAIVVTGETAPNDPIVTITAPASGAPYEIGDNVTVEATAVAQKGTITGVEFKVDGTSIGTDNSAPYTATYSNATEGDHTITVTATDSDGDATTKAVSISVTIPQGPFGGTAWAIPGKIEFENFDVCGNGCAYFDNSSGSSVPTPPDYRSDEDVDIEVCTDTDGGYNVGYGIAGEWLEYTVNVATAGTYDLVIRASTDGDKTVSLSYEDGTSIAGDISIPSTGGWQTWTDVTVSGITLEAGEHTLRLTIGASDYVNLNYMTFSTDEPIKTPPTISIDSPNDKDAFTADKTVTIKATATATNATITNVKFYAGTQLLNTDNTAPYTYDWSGMDAGVYEIKAVVTDSNNMLAEDLITVTINEAPVSIPLKAGWNLVGFPYENSQDIATALASITDKLECVKDDDGFWNAGQTTHLNSLETLEWGKGYFVKVSAQCSLIWNP